MKHSVTRFITVTNDIIDHKYLLVRSFDDQLGFRYKLYYENYFNPCLIDTTDEKLFLTFFFGVTGCD
jgi:hypothetical protein